VCTFCGAALWISTRGVNSGSGWEDIPESIECDGTGCYATWKPDGTYLTGGDDDD
jgi:hypothetical protein